MSDMSKIKVKHADAVHLAERRRERLAREAQAGHDFDELAATLVLLAEAEGAARAWGTIGMAVEHDPENGVPAAIDLLRQSPDDTWSGRTNDIKRAYNDGIRKVAGDFIRDNIKGA